MSIAVIQPYKYLLIFIIKQGRYAHDEYCSDPEHCVMARLSNGDSCATTFTNEDGEVLCATAKGNAGLKYQTCELDFAVDMNILGFYNGL